MLACRSVCMHFMHHSLVVRSSVRTVRSYRTKRFASIIRKYIGNTRKNDLLICAHRKDQFEQIEAKKKIRITKLGKSIDRARPSVEKHLFLTTCVCVWSVYISKIVDLFRVNKCEHVNCLLFRLYNFYTQITRDLYFILFNHHQKRKWLKHTHAVIDNTILNYFLCIIYERAICV